MYFFRFQSEPTKCLEYRREVAKNEIPIPGNEEPKPKIKIQTPTKAESNNKLFNAENDIVSR